MSVYHSIKTAQDAAESFVKLDLSVKESKKEKRAAKENVQRKVCSKYYTTFMLAVEILIFCMFLLYYRILKVLFNHEHRLVSVWIAKALPN